jgi:hypothetical protein
MTAAGLLREVRAYYTNLLAEHGPTPRGVDWNSAESQKTRFEQLLGVCPRGGPFRLGDYGCGYGALYDYVQRAGFECHYRGYDIGDPRAVFNGDEGALAGSDYVVASGVFNVKLGSELPEWEAYVRATIDRLAGLARRGFAFNALTSYADPERMRADLYYADPCFLFDYCKRRFSKNVALLHDYGLCEFTILVRR